MPSTHRQWKLVDRHSFDCLKIQEAPIPEPQGNEVLIKGGYRHAAPSTTSQSRFPKLPRRFALIFEKYPAPVKDDLIPLSDAAGEVVSLGPNARRWTEGDKVKGVCLPDWIAGRRKSGSSRNIGNQDDGVLQEYMVVEEQALVSMPTRYSFEEGSTLACAALTAWNALT